jgi:hypothetical protein
LISSAELTVDSASAAAAGPGDERGTAGGMRGNLP